MNAADLVKFQVQNSKSSDSTGVNIKIFESDEIFRENSQNSQNLKSGGKLDMFKIGKQRSRKLALCIFSVVLLWALMISIFCLGLFIGNSGQDLDMKETLKEMKSALSDLKNETETASHHLTSEISQPPVTKLHQDVENPLHNSPAPQETSSPTDINYEIDQVRGQLDEMENTLLDLDKKITEQGKNSKTLSKVSSDLEDLEHEIGAQHDEIKEEVRGQLDDLDSKMTDMINSTRNEVKKEISSTGDDLKKGISGIKDQMNTKFAQFKLQTMNSSSSASESTRPEMAATTAPPTFIIPRFYVDENYKNGWFSPRPGWEDKCTEMPPHMNRQASSVQLGHLCLLVCTTTNCQDSGHYEGKKCIEIHPDFYGLDNFKKMDYNDQIRSFRLCKTK